MQCNIKTDDDVQLKTSSKRRYVVFTISDDSIASIHSRTDDRAKAIKQHNRARRNALRVVVVDTLNSTIVDDS